MQSNDNYHIFDKEAHSILQIVCNFNTTLGFMAKLRKKTLQIVRKGRFLSIPKDFRADRKMTCTDFSRLQDLIESIRCHRRPEVFAFCH
jgi:hypothetical protein